MIQRRQHARFTLKSRNAFAVVTEGFGQKLDGDTAAQLRIGGLIDISHSTRSDVTRDFVMCELAANHGVNEIWRRILSNNPKSPNHRGAIEVG
jgi:hypothetical protein